MAKTLIVGELQQGTLRDATLELVAMARELGGDVVSLVLGSGIQSQAEELSKKGGGKVLAADDAALASLLGNKGNTTAFVQAAYHAYWREGANLDCWDTVTALWTAGPNETIAIDLDALATHQLEAEQSGIVGAPAFVAAGEIFIGRAHLPLIRELLGTANP